MAMTINAVMNQIRSQAGFLIVDEADLQRVEDELARYKNIVIHSCAIEIQMELQCVEVTLVVGNKRSEVSFSIWLS